MLAPVLQGLGIEVRHHRTFLTRLAFPLIGLAAGGLHLSPSLGDRRVESGCMASLALKHSQNDVETHFHSIVLLCSSAVKAPGPQRRWRSLRWWRVCRL